AKRHISRAIGHFGQLLKRRGWPHVGITVYEAGEAGRDLHAHHLVHVPKALRDAVGRWCDGEARHVRPAHPQSVAYVTKQRRRLSPDVERRIRQLWMRGSPVPGRRWSATAEARTCGERVEGGYPLASGSIWLSSAFLGSEEGTWLKNERCRC